MLGQARPPLSDCNGSEKEENGGKVSESDESEMSRLRRINAEQANTIVQLRKTQDPSKSQLRVGWTSQRRNQDEQPVQEAPGPRKKVFVQEGQAQQTKPQQSLPNKEHENMLRTSRATSDSDEEPSISQAYCVQVRKESFRPNEIVEPMQKVPNNVNRRSIKIR